jgi:hypothetical protein
VCARRAGRCVRERSDERERRLPRTDGGAVLARDGQLFEVLELRIPGGEVFDTVTGPLEGEAFAASLNPGHLIHYEEWMDSPIPAGSHDPIASGMVLQSDIITAFWLAPDLALAFS